MHFQWQLMDWPAPPAVLAAAGISTASMNTDEKQRGAHSAASGQLVQVPPPLVTHRGGTSASGFRGSKQPVHPNQDARNAKLGLAGEVLVLRAEKARLLQAGRPDLAGKVTHVSVVEGDAAGYDIRSWKTDGDGHGKDVERFIEVKTTRGAATTAFFITPNEIAFSQANEDRYYIARVFGYDEAEDGGSFYEVNGSVTNSFALQPTEYRATYSSDEAPSSPRGEQCRR